MRVEKVIEELGYKPNEAKVYIAALGLGESHISDIAEKVGLPRSSVQQIVDKLHKDGLMHFYVQHRYKFWAAENPERLLAMLTKCESEVRAALPELIALRRNRRGRTKTGNDRQRSVELLRTIADASPEAMLITNGDADIEYVNAPWEKLFGYTCTEVRGKNPSMLKSGRTARETYAELWRALDADRMFQSREIIDRDKDGKEVRLVTTIFPLEHNRNSFFVQILDSAGGSERIQALQKSIRSAF